MSKTILPPVEIITEDVFACELTEEQVAIARDRFRGEPKPLILNPEEQSARNHELEAATRKKARK